MYRGKRKVQMQKAHFMMLRHRWEMEKINPTPPTPVNEIFIKCEEKELTLKGQFEELFGWYYYPTLKEKRMIVCNNEQKRISVAVKGNDLVEKLKSKLSNIANFRVVCENEVPTASISSSQKDEVTIIVDVLQEIVA
jgi:hypothetical protein